MNYSISHTFKSFAAVTFSCALLVGCGSQQSGNDDSAASQSTGSTTSGSQIKIKGSDTMSSLATRFKEEFNVERPDVDISVAGGGSGTGIKAMIEGTADICNSSRPIKESEMESAEAAGITPVEHVVGKDGIAVIVHPSNPVDNLTLKQIEDIFTGNVSNWSEVGGSDGEIVVYTRDGASGTYVLFQELAMDNNDYTISALQQKSNASIVKEILTVEGGIGYSGIGFLEGQDVKAVGVAESADGDFVIPTNDTIGSGEYPIARPLLMYTNGKETGDVKAFFEFIYSADGQAVVEEVGFTPLPAKTYEAYE